MGKWYLNNKDNEIRVTPLQKVEEVNFLELFLARGGTTSVAEVKKIG